jgi:hypothetical protein
MKALSNSQVRPLSRGWRGRLSQLRRASGFGHRRGGQRRRGRRGGGSLSLSIRLQQTFLAARDRQT